MLPESGRLQERQGPIWPGSMVLPPGASGPEPRRH